MSDSTATAGDIHDSNADESAPRPEADVSEMIPDPADYRLPAEWEPHEATWLAWPHHREDWPGKFAPIGWVYTEIVRYLSRHEQTNILVNSNKRARHVADRLEKAGATLERVRFFKVPTDRSWTRDYGPLCVVRQVEVGSAPDAGPAAAIVDGRFNGWAKYANCARDDRVARRVARRLGLPRFKPRAEMAGRRKRVVLEGGAIDVNGRGTLLTTEECLLSDEQARNPGLGRDALEKIFETYLGVRHVVWLGRGIVGDDTHGHVDDLARFVDPQTVVAVVEARAADENYVALRENWERLTLSRDQDGRPLRVVSLPMPAPVFFSGQRLPASYANFYVANGVVLVPTFNDPADREALETIEALFPDRTVVGIHSVDLVWGLGTLHCMTRDQPAVPSSTTS